MLAEQYAARKRHLKKHLAADDRGSVTSDNETDANDDDDDDNTIDVPMRKASMHSRYSSRHRIERNRMQARKKRQDSGYSS